VELASVKAGARDHRRTAKLLDVVLLVTKGLAIKDIAARPFVSPRTVQTHLALVYTKLGLASHVQLFQRPPGHTVGCGQPRYVGCCSPSHPMSRRQ
jgi:DNA-binding NarL/FixJ family response regulator